ncbi:hypothetical protein [Phyllobacterium phragmitis]|nr:hypothetical protein [Phyllobacterium phragmitis]
MWNLPDLSMLFYLAIFGLISAVACLIGGLAWLIYFIVNHVKIV